MSSAIKFGIGAVGLLVAGTLVAGQFTTLKTGENGLYVGFDGHGQFILNKVKDVIAERPSYPYLLGLRLEGPGSS